MLNVHMESRTRELNILQERNQNLTDVQSKLETALEKSRQVISFYLKMTSCDTLHYLRPGIGNDTGKVRESGGTWNFDADRNTCSEVSFSFVAHAGNVETRTRSTEVI